MKCVALVLLFAACALAASLTEKQYQDAFTDWMVKYQRSYNAGDFAARYSVFKTNLDYVNAWNAANHTSKLEANMMADLTNAEYQKIYLGTHIDARTRLMTAANKWSPLRVDAPTTVNWVTQGAVTGVKDQGQCGSCWSFSTTGSVEGVHFLSTKKLVSLSEQNLVDCSTSEGNLGCSGGLMDYAFEYIISNKGIDTEASYPYTGVDGTCQFNKKNVGATISSYKDIASGSESDLLNAVVNQPVSVAIDASATSFQLYSSGVYYEASCSSTQLDHGVLAVGYGTSGSSAYWLVKNSWGDAWGLNGYIWMSRNRDNNCGIATSASYPIA